MTAGPPANRQAHVGDTRSSARGRIAAVVLVAAALGGGGALGGLAAHASPRTALEPAALAAEAAPPRSVSSSWFCSGSPAEAAGTTHLLLTNAASTASRVAVTVTDTGGAIGRQSIRLGPHEEADVVPGQLLHGAWLATQVTVTGGEVGASELLDGRDGRTVTSCASEVSPRWYFASGSTRKGSTLNVSLFNPTPNLAVVDLSFVTASGLTAPAPFQGLVVSPGALRILTVGQYVQNDATVATVVSTRAGAIVASELELYGPGGRAGVSLSLGAPSPSTRWELPEVEDLTGGASSVAVFNPTVRTEHVSVDARLPTGSVAPFTETLAPDTVWSLPTSAELRIATDEPYTLEVRAPGSGVVVARVGAGGRDGPVPWWAQSIAVTTAQTSGPRSWVVPSLDGSASMSATNRTLVTPAASLPPSAPGRRVHAASSAPQLVLENPGGHQRRVEITSWTPSGRHVSVVRVGGYGVRKLAAPDGPALVSANGPLAVIADDSPAETSGVIGIPAVPLR